MQSSKKTANLVIRFLPKQPVPGLLNLSWIHVSFCSYVLNFTPLKFMANNRVPVNPECSILQLENFHIYGG